MQKAKKCEEQFVKGWSPTQHVLKEVTSNCKGTTKKSLSYERFELWVMLSRCCSHVATVACSSRFSVPHFLAKISKIARFSLYVKQKKMKLSLLHKNVNPSSHRKGNLMALTAVYQFELWLKVRGMPSKLSLPRQGPWNLVWVKQVFELSEVELTEFHCISFSLPIAYMSLIWLA